MTAPTTAQRQVLERLADGWILLDPDPIFAPEGMLWRRPPPTVWVGKPARGPRRPVLRRLYELRLIMKMLSGNRSREFRWVLTPEGKAWLEARHVAVPRGELVLEWGEEAH